MSLDVRVLVMDEPTAALSAHDGESAVPPASNGFRELGVAAVLCVLGHRLDEVFEDRRRRVSVLPRTAATSRPSSIAEVAARRPDRAREMVAARTPPSSSFVPLRRRVVVVLSVEGLGRRGVFQDVSSELRRAWPCSVLAGLVGAGRSTTSRWPCSASPRPTRAPSSSTVSRSPSAPPPTPSGAASPISARTVAELGLSIDPVGHHQHHAGHARWLHVAVPGHRRPFWRRRSSPLQLRDRLGIVTASLDTPVEHLSGGNQQKTMLGKWLNTEPRVLILDEPTRGIDVGAEAEVHRFIDELARAGMAIIMIFLGTCRKCWR